MVKKILCIFFSLLCVFLFSLTATCQQSEEYYEEYDNYSEFEEDYIDNYVVDTPTRKIPIISKFSFPIMFVGAAIGAGACYLMLRKFLYAPQAQPHIRKPKQKSETVFENDSLIG